MGTKQAKYRHGAHLAHMPSRAGWFIKWSEPRGQTLVIPYTPSPDDPLLDLREGDGGCIITTRPPNGHPMHHHLVVEDCITHVGELRIHTPADMQHALVQYIGQQIGIRARRGKAGTTARWKKAGETREQAEVALGQFLCNRDREKQGLPPLLSPVGYTFQQLVDETIDWARSPLSGYSPQSLCIFCYMLNKLGRQWGHMPLANFTANWMSQWATARGTEVSSGSLGNYIKLWRVVFKLAIQRQYITTNPSVGLKIPKQRAARPKYLDEAQISLLLECCAQEDAQRLAPLGSRARAMALANAMRPWYNTDGTFDAARVRFLLYTGLRKSQLTSMTWQQYDPARGSIVLESRADHSEKSKRVTVIPLPRQARLIIEGQPQGAPYIFPNTRGTRDKNIEYRFRKIAARVKQRGGAHVHLHLLRHTALTMLLKHTHDLAAVSKFAGHSNTQITQRYSWVLDSELKLQVEDFNPMQAAGETGK